nr:MAG TPA: hypothetical protein [Caudoviricetes sp.]DAO63111.1 MAG TPA: hypothetical protein [Caudoviricetes sp.]
MNSITKKKEAADRIYSNAVELFHTTGYSREGRSLPSDAKKVMKLLDQIKRDVCVLYDIKPSGE